MIMKIEKSQKAAKNKGLSLVKLTSEKLVKMRLAFCFAKAR